MTGITSVTDLMRAGERLLAEQIEAGARATENHLTNELFWLEYPSLRDEKLQAGTPEAIRWIRIRDTVVHPLLAARAKSAPSTGWNPPPGKSGPPAGTVPAAQIAAGSGGGSGSAQASLDDKYFLQDTGHYQDVSDDKGQTRVWMYGSSGMNICNMTTLTMGLVSMAGESEVRSKIIALLKSKGMHGGASVKIGKEWVPLATALDDPKVVDQIGLLDLVTAAAIGEHGNYGDVSLPGTIARVARDTGLAIKSAYHPRAAPARHREGQNHGPGDAGRRQTCDRRHHQSLRLSDRGKRRQRPPPRPGGCARRTQPEGAGIPAQRLCEWHCGRVVEAG